MRGYKESPPGRDRGGQVPRGLTTPTGDSIVAQPRLTMRREDLPQAWGGPPEFPPQQHQLAQSAEFGKRVLRHLKHENDPYYDVVPLEMVIRFRYESGKKRAGPLRYLWTERTAPVMVVHLACGCVGSHHWFAPCNWRAQNDYEGELLGAVRP